MSEILITPDLFNNLNYDIDTMEKAAGDSWNDSTVLIVFSNSDINAAIYHLIKSMEAPWENKAVATVLVQESIKTVFIEKFQQQIKPFHGPYYKGHTTMFLVSVSNAKKLNAQIIGVPGTRSMVDTFERNFTPTLVCDFTHEQFGDSQPTGVVTLHTFRTAKEVISLVSKETLDFKYASIWHENHAYAYELVASLNSDIFYINCYHVPMTILDESVREGKAFVAMDKSYHYETMPCAGLQKSIVFPIGSIFAN